jgi:hypothetical protein
MVAAIAMLLTGVTSASASAGIVASVRQPDNPHAQSGWTSKNWAGYAITGAHYTSIGAGWAVPTVQTPNGKADAYSLSWIGIDGFANSNLIQVGTEQDYYRGVPYYRAFYEILPAAETPITTIDVHAGDFMTAGISYAGSSRWNIRITNTRTGQTFTTQQTYKGPGASAEWIHEAPYLGSRPTRLTPTTPVTFDHGTANGENANLTLAERGRMVNGNHTVAIPSRPDGDTDGFTVADGANAPAPPAS